MEPRVPEQHVDAFLAKVGCTPGALRVKTSNKWDARGINKHDCEVLAHLALSASSQLPSMRALRYWQRQVRSGLLSHALDQLTPLPPEILNGVVGVLAEADRVALALVSTELRAAVLGRLTSLRCAYTHSANASALPPDEGALPVVFDPCLTLADLTATTSVLREQSSLARL
jgi:hypothetical protein